MTSNAVPGFLPSRNGFRFANRWPAGAARTWQLGLLTLGIGDVGRGLCGGMAFAARDRFERGEAAPPDRAAPGAGSPLFREIVDRQFDSFGRFLVEVPVRFLVAALASDRSRWRATVRDAWPAIRRDIDAGALAMLGLVRRPGPFALARDFGHQVVAYRYDVTAGRVAIGVYDPNHPGDDAVEVGFERASDGRLMLWQSTGEPLLGLLHLPWRARSGAAPASTRRDRPRRDPPRRR
jgi:hypothetical protein